MQCLRCERNSSTNIRIKLFIRRFDLAISGGAETSAQSGVSGKCKNLIVSYFRQQKKPSQFNLGLDTNRRNPGGGRIIARVPIPREVFVIGSDWNFTETK